MIPGAEHTACTIEMLDTAKRVDVAVVDEVQVDSQSEGVSAGLLSVIYSSLRYKLLKRGVCIA